MHKIPVLATASRAYGFLIGDLPTIIRLSWAAMVAAAAVQYLYGLPIMEAAALDRKPDLSRAAELYPLNFLIGLVGFLAGIIVTVALLRVVIFGDRKPGLPLYLWFGAAESRLVLVTILLGIAFVAAAIGAALVIALLAALSTAIPIMGVVLFVAMIALVFVCVWAALRLSLIGAVVVAENSLGVERSWAIMKGNALRMFAVLLLTVAPYLILTSIAYNLAMGADAPVFPQIAVAPGSSYEVISAAVGAAMEVWQRQFAAAMVKHWEAVSIVGLLSTLLGAALQAGAVGSAYRAIVGEGQGADGPH